jgi:hypothetical protein
MSHLRKAQADCPSQCGRHSDRDRGPVDVAKSDGSTERIMRERKLVT